MDKWQQIYRGQKKIIDIKTIEIQIRSWACLVAGGGADAYDPAKSMKRNPTISYVVAAKLLMLSPKWKYLTSKIICSVSFMYETSRYEFWSSAYLVQ